MVTLAIIKTQARLVGCMHTPDAKFTDGTKSLGKHKSGKVDWGNSTISQKRTRIETQIKDKTIDERYRIRQEESLPLLRQIQNLAD